MMTPEEFLKNHDAIVGVTEAMSPLYDLLATMRDDFLGSGFSQESAELLTIKLAEIVLFPMLRKEDT